MLIYDMEVRQGETFKEQVKLIDLDGDPINLTGRTAKAQVRKNPNDSTLIAEMTCAHTSEKGSITFQLSSAQTADIPVGTYYYDVCSYQAASGGTNVKYYIGGKFKVLPSVTKVV